MSNDHENAPDVVAYRGDTKLSKDALHAHLATILRLEHVGIFLGAGASVDLGGMTIEQLWNYFTDTYAESHETLIEEEFVEDEEVIPNVEELMDQLLIACLEAERSQSSKYDQLINAQLNLRRSVVHASILNDDYWSDPAVFQKAPDALANHCALLQKIRGARQPGQPAPWVFTPNYDLAIEWAAETVGLEVMNGFRGIHNRTFSPHAFDLGLRNTLARGEARFGCYEVYLAKLHGSLTWLSTDERSVIERPANAIWDLIESFRDSESDEFGQKMVFPSAAKYMQTIGFVHGELFRRFTEFLNRPQTALIVNGYSFSDDHLNRILLTALQNPTLSLVIYASKAEISEEGVEVPEEYPVLKRVAALKSPQVTIVGNGRRAYLASLAADLPDPAIFDERSHQIRQMLKEFKVEL